MVLKENRLKLARIAGIETVEIIETEAAGPVVKWADLAGFPCGRVVVLADPRRRVTTLPQDFRHRSCAPGDDACVAVIAGRKFSDHSCPRHMVVATGEQCRACR